MRDTVRDKKQMDVSTVQRKKSRMRILFLMFASLIPVGGIFALGSSFQWVGVALFLLGCAAGTVCAFTNCPCCGRLSGVFFKGFFGGAFPVGKCIHCKSSYMHSNGCTDEP